MLLCFGIFGVFGGWKFFVLFLFGLFVVLFWFVRVILGRDWWVLVRFFYGGKAHRGGVMSPLLFSVSEKTKLCGFLPGLIQGCITFSVSPLESQNNFVISLLNRHESGPLYTKSGRNLVLLTQSSVCKVYCASGSKIRSHSIVIKTMGLFYLSSHF